MELIQEAQSISNGTIIAQYQKNISFITKNIKKIDSIWSFSRIIRIITWLMLPLAAIAGWLYAVELDKNLFIKIVFCVAGICVSGIASGVIILLLKPIFYFTRIPKYKLSKKLQKAESENRSLESIYITQNTPNPLPPISKELYEANTKKLTFQQIVKDYNNISNEYIVDLDTKRKIRLEKEKGAEWAWVGTAGILLLVLGTIALMLVALYFLLALIFIIILIAMVVGYFNSGRDYIPPQTNDYNYDYANPNPKIPFGEKLFEWIANITYSSWLSACDGLKKIKSKLSENEIHKGELYRLLKFYIPQIDKLHKE